MSWIRKLPFWKPAPLRGAPPVRRLKSYSAQSGYVYQYYYEGYRGDAERPDGHLEFVFDVSADRKTSFPVSVVLRNEILAEWAARRNRKLNSTERYAIAKMALFQAFDERRNPGELREAVRVPAADVESILSALGLDE